MRRPVKDDTNYSGDEKNENIKDNKRLVMAAATHFKNTHTTLEFLYIRFNTFLLLQKETMIE